MQTIENYALEILAQCGCDCYTYGGENSVHIMDDLKEGFPDGMKFPYVDVANAILAISRPEPIKRAPWRMIWETDDACDGVDCESLEDAKDGAEETLTEWATEERSKWESDLPTEKEREDWNCMVNNCSVSVRKYNPCTDRYEEYWEPSYEDEKRIGWEEIQ